MAIFDRSVRVSTGIVSVTDEWVNVRTAYWYPDEAEMVVVAQPIYSAGEVGGVVRIRNVTNNRFQIRIQNPAGDEISDPVSVCWLALPTGTWSNNEIKFEARRVNSGLVDRSGSWVGETFNYDQAYANPVVLGQVMTSNDDAWSVFWSRGAALADRPSPVEAFVGRHVGEDPNVTRADETLGVVVFEAGTSEINGVTLVAGHTSASVVGIDDNNVHTHALGGVYALTGIASSAGMKGNDGAWPVLVGANRYEPFSNGSLALVVDEDTIANAERAHLAEEIAFLGINGDKDGARFTSQATLGAYFNEFRDPFRDGYAAWIDQQRNTPVSLITPYMDELNDIQAELGTNEGIPGSVQQEVRNSYPGIVSYTNQSSPNALNFSTAWTRNLIKNPDQLRQRVAWTLSQVMVISANFSALSGVGASLADFYDTLSRNALGSFRTLLREVSVHPAMGYYLSHLGNQKASADGSRQPDENYAREVMQLFSIGLWELNPDGTQKMVGGEPVPTYGNEDVTNLARVFTGLWYEGIGFGQQSGLRNHQGPNRRPLAMDQSRHDTDPKVIFPGKPWELNLDGTDDGMVEIEKAVDALVDHPNTPPFMASHLIRFLVTSNPSPAYVERVANVFINNGAGVRGDLHATVRQVLLDYEARAYFRDRPDYGKVVEPMVRITSALKAFRAGRDMPTDDIYYWRSGGSTAFFGQWPMYSPSVFNFFQPDYELGGSFRDTGLVAPEMQLMNPITAATGPNELRSMIDAGIHRLRSAVTPDFELNFADEIAAAANPPALVERLNLLLCRGQMSDGTRSVILEKVSGISNPENVVKIAVWIALICPESVVLR